MSLTTNETDRTEERRAASRRALSEHTRLVSSGQIEEWIGLYAPDGVIEFPFAPPGVPQRVQGHDALKAHMVGFPRTFDIEFVDFTFHDTGDPSVVIAEYRSTGRAVPTGKPYEQTVITVVHTDDRGLITRFVDYWNPLVVIESLTPDDGAPATDVPEGFGG